MRRKLAAKKLWPTGCNACFHDGYRRLSVVDELHRDVLSHKIESDFVSPTVSGIIQDFMLVPRSERKLGSKDLHCEWKERLALAQRMPFEAWNIKRQTLAQEIPPVLSATTPACIDEGENQTTTPAGTDMGENQRTTPACTDEGENPTTTPARIDEGENQTHSKIEKDEGPGGSENLQDNKGSYAGYFSGPLVIAPKRDMQQPRRKLSLHHYIGGWNVKLIPQLFLKVFRPET